MHPNAKVINSKQLHIVKSLHSQAGHRAAVLHRRISSATFSLSCHFCHRSSAVRRLSGKCLSTGMCTHLSLAVQLLLRSINAFLCLALQGWLVPLAASPLSTEALLLCVTAGTCLGSVCSCSGLLELLTESTKGAEEQEA